jgi:hypothetical protein
MRKLLMMVVIGTAVGLCALPAGSAAAQLEGGLKFGVNIAFLRGANAANFTSFGSSNWFLRFGLCGGGFLALPLNGSLAIQAEALITTKGSHETGTWGGEPTYVYSLKITYLEIPVLLRVMTRPIKKTAQIFFMAGPALGLKLGSRFMRSSEVIEFNGVKSTDLGLVLSLGYVLRSRGYTEFRYIAGMSKMIEEAGVPLNIKNGVVSVIVGYRF